MVGRNYWQADGDAMILFTTSQGRLTLLEVFAAIAGKQPLELLRMRPHQRVPVVTGLAVMMTAIRAYAMRPPHTAPEWEDEWMHQVGEDALRLTAPDDEVAFFQPPLSGNDRSEMTLSDLDLVFARAAHAIKPVADGTAEEAVLALMSGAHKLSVIKWNGTTRWGISAVLPSDDATLAGEVRHLCAAYEQGSKSVRGSGTSAADHFLWMRPTDEHGLSLDSLPYPYLEARPCRLVEALPGRYKGRGERLVPFRIAGKPHADDPHTPLNAGKPYRLWGARVWSMKPQYEMLFSSPDTKRPRVLNIPGYRAVRVCGLGVDQGKTLGYWEALYPLEQQAVFSLTDQPDRAAELSQRALDAADRGEKVLRRAVSALDESRQVRARAARLLRDALAASLTNKVLKLLARDPDLTSEQQALARITADGMRSVWRLVSMGYDALVVAKGADRLNSKIHEMTGDTVKDDLTALGKQVYATLGGMAAHLTPGDRATLRTALQTSPPMLYWMLLAQVPERLRDTPEAETVWRATLPLLGAISPGGKPVGRVLAETGYPEMRLRQLIGATDTTLVGLLGEVSRWLVVHEETHVDLSSLIALGLADALGDEATRIRLRQQFALDYVRRRRKAAAAPVTEET